MSEKILLVEDDADLHLGLALRLRSRGFEVLSALSAREVLPIAMTQQPHLILLDIGLPDEDGHAVASALGDYEETRGIPIVYLTARHETSHRIRAESLRASAYLVKPCRPERLFDVIEGVLDARRR